MQDAEMVWVAGRAKKEKYVILLDANQNASCKGSQPYVTPREALATKDLNAGRTEHAQVS